MKRLFVMAGIGLLLASHAFAQRPGGGLRQRPVLAVPQGPRVMSYPDGVYSNLVSGELTGQTNNGFFPLGTWSVTFTTPGTCEECDPGQYFMAAAFAGVTYADGTQELGTAFGYVNPSGGIIEFNVYTTNCTNTPTRVPQLQGGNFGPAPGVRVQLDRDRGAMRGHVSGYTCYGETISADFVLGKEGR
jgi:hypothetical protein